MTQQTQPALAADDDGTAPRRIARSLDQRRLHRIADHGIRKQSQCQHDADHPKTSAVTVSNHASA